MREYAQKISISLSQFLYDFVENYQKTYSCKSRSEVISEALMLLQQKQLEGFYKEANKEINNDFESTLPDGLANEAW